MNKIIQWTMDIPQELHHEFINFSKSTLQIIWKKFGAIEYKLFQSHTNPNKFIEQLYFSEKTDINQFFQKVKSDPNAVKISQSYEQQFHAINIEREILDQL